MKIEEDELNRHMNSYSLGQSDFIIYRSSFNFSIYRFQHKVSFLLLINYIIKINLTKLDLSVPTFNTMIMDLFG